MKTKFLWVALLGLMISSCGGNEDTANNADTTGQEDTVKTCLYSYDGSTSKVEFTSYKFLNKTGVGGVFENMEVQAGEANESAAEVMKSLSFKIPILSIFTKDEGRDKKIITYFFETIHTDTISGKVLGLDEETGKALLEITMNAVTNKVEGDYTLNDGAFTFNAEINVDNWNAQSGIKALNKECKDLHTDHANGDKESKLWSDVTISFSTELKKDCE